MIAAILATAEAAGDSVRQVFPPAEDEFGFLPVLLLVLLAAGFAVSNVIMTSFLGPARMGAVKAIPYESGVDPVGDTKQPFVVQYYLVAILFLLFDVELVFLYPWAVCFRDEVQKGADGNAGLLLVSMLVFLVVLVLAFAYEWFKGVLDWNPRRDGAADVDVKSD